MTSHSMPSPRLQIDGHCDERFASVRQAFARNFEQEGEVGAAVCVYHKHQKVVDLSGGWRDAQRTQPWTPDTVLNVWSCTKGVAAACFAMLVDRGQAQYERPVADWWPEFGAAGKGQITLAMLLSHQAGLCGFTSPATIDDLLAGEAAAVRLAAQEPLWTLGSASGYHAISGGILATALFQRIEGRSLRQFVADELAGQRGFDISIGLPATEVQRVATMIAPSGMRSSQIASLTRPQTAALVNPPLTPLLPNSQRWRDADLPSANGHSNARGLAALYASMLDTTQPLLGADALAQATQLRVDNVDLVLGVPSRWAAGFLLSTEGCFGPNPEAFGHSGWGGSLAFADPRSGLSFAYVMNRMGTTLRGDPRNTALIEAAYASV